MPLGDPEVPMTQTALTATKPTQEQLDTAAKVLWWLYAHARLFPDEWSPHLAKSTLTGDVLVGAANACGGDLTMLPTTVTEQQEQDALNRHQLHSKDTQD